MKKTRLLAIAVALVALVVSIAPPAEAGVFSRVRSAGSALLTETQAQRAWVTIPPTANAAGDFETIVVSTSGSDPTLPAFVLQIQSTDGRFVGEKLKPGALVTLRRVLKVETGGPLPVVVVDAYKAGGWRARRVKRMSDTYAQWGYLIAGRAASAGDGSLYERFFGPRPGLRARFEADLAKTYEVALGGPPKVVEARAPVILPPPGGCSRLLEGCRGSLELCRDDSGQVRTKLRQCETLLSGARNLADWVLDSPAGNGHHPELVEKAKAGRATIDGYFNPAL